MINLRGEDGEWGVVSEGGQRRFCEGVKWSMLLLQERFVPNVPSYRSLNDAADGVIQLIPSIRKQKSSENIFKIRRYIHIETARDL